MMNLTEARQTIDNNTKIVGKINKLTELFNVILGNLNEEIIPVDNILGIQIGICDHYREKYPNRIKSDEEIIEHYNMLEDKYGITLNLIP